MMTELNETKIRKKLEDQRAEIQEEINSLEEQRSGADAMNPDRSDLAQSFSSLERLRAHLERNREQLEQIEAALKRLDDGTYGKCSNCGKPINPDRLELLPHAQMCVECQSK